MVIKLSPKVKVVFKITGGLALVGFLTLVGLALYYAKDLPNPSRINKRIIAQSTKIYDRTGEQLLYEIHGEEKRTVIPAVQIPAAVKYATIVLEDQEFYRHHGVDFKGILRAALKDVLKGSAAQGGSTITQQFVKNSILTSKKRLSRKIKEIVLAVEIETKFSKDEILQMYLNEIPYGANAYGIEAAAQTFFGVHARDLTLAQSALLASLPKAPTYYSPFGSHTDRLLARWRYALSQMARQGYITSEQAERAKQENILEQIRPLQTNIKAPHFVLYVKEQLVKEFGEEQVEKGGLQVYTTLDWDLQQIAERVVKEGVEKNGPKFNFSNAALVALNPHNGQVLAMVGSKDYFDKSIDGNVNVALRPRQPGSSFKPYVYAAAFLKGYTPDTLLFDVDTFFPMENGQEYNPKNYDNRNHGPVKMKEALAMSLNVPAVKALYLAGIDNAISLARKMGITTLNDPSRYGLALVLGGAEVKLLDHVAAFSVFADQGIKHEKTVILKIKNADNRVIKNYENEQGQRVLDAKVAWQICDILSNNSLRAPVFGSNSFLNIPGYQVAAKTGTTNEWRDGWLVGATPSLAVGVWAGNNDNHPMATGADGSYVAGPIWHNFMVEALKNVQPEEFKKPNIPEDEKINEKELKPVLNGTLKIEDKIEVCRYGKKKYCLANKHCPDSLRDKKKFFSAHCILYYVDRDDPQGDYPEHPENDPQFKAWEKAVQKWAREKAKKDDLRIAPERECRESDFKDVFSQIEITNPVDGETITTQTIEIKAAVSGEAEVKQVDFFFKGKAIGSDKNKPYEISYKIPSEDNNHTAEIEAKVYDEEGGKDNDKITVQVAFSQGS